MLLISTAFAKPPALDPLVADLVPRVEAAAGRKFGQVPPVRLVRAEDLALATIQESAKLQQLQHGALSPAAIQQLQYSGSAIARHLIGKYFVFDHQILVSKEGWASTAAALHADRDLALECVLAHELTHALQAEAGGLEAVASDPERFEAADLVAEGHALLIGEKVCRELGGDALIDPMRKMVGFAGTDGLSPYQVGSEFVEPRLDRIWDLIADPPADPGSILWPDRPAPAPVDPPYPAVDRALGTLFEGSPVHLPVDPLNLLQADGNTLDVRAAVEQMQRGWSSAWTLPPGTARASVLRFADPAGANAYVAAKKAAIGNLHGSGLYAISTHPPEAVDGLDGAFRYTRAITLLMGNSPPPLRVDGWVAASGPWVVELELIELQRKDDQVQPALKALIGALSEG